VGPAWIFRCHSVKNGLFYPLVLPELESEGKKSDSSCMSHISEREVICPACKQPIVAELWSSVNVKEDPELKDLLLGGELNIVECSACREKFHVDTFLLYHDPDNEILAFVFPLDSDLPADELAEKTTADFELSQATLPENEQLKYSPVHIKGLDELVRFVEADDESALQSEVLEAIAKEHDMSLTRLGPWKARQQSLPRLLPVENGEGRSAREAVLAGLKKLKTLNDRLTVYNDVLDRLSADSRLAVEIS
jgi:hypothetical protein